MSKKNSLEIIIELVQNYNSLPDDFNVIESLLKIRKDIATNSVNLSTDVAESRRLWKMSMVEYEINKNQIRVMNLEKGTTKADYISRANTKNEFEKLAKMESNYYDLHYLLNQIKEVLSELNQRIAYLRAEKGNSNLF